MIVRFQNRFHVPGFGRNRFPKGIVRDVPESLRDMLPSTAVILDDDHPTDADLRVEADLKAADEARAHASSMDVAALKAKMEVLEQEKAQAEADAEEVRKSAEEFVTNAKAAMADGDKKPSRTKKGK